MTLALFQKPPCAASCSTALTVEELSADFSPAAASWLVMSPHESAQARSAAADPSASAIETASVASGVNLFAMSFPLLSLKSLGRLRPALLALAIAALLLGVTAQRMLSDIKEAPEVRFSTLTGEMFNMSDLRGRVVLVNFWASSCAPCVKEMPQLAATWKKYEARGFDTIAVAMDYDPPNLVTDFARRFNLPFRVAFDPRGEIALRFGKVHAVPTSFVIDRRGRIVFNQVGELDFTALDTVLEAALKEPPS